MLRVLNPETGMLPNITSNEELDFYVVFIIIILPLEMNILVVVSEG